LRDERPLLLRQRGEEVEDERVNVGAELGDELGTRWTIKPEMKCTSRESRSSLETITGPPSFRAALMAAASSLVPSP
jgi:hypothetical protein